MREWLSPIAMLFLLSCATLASKPDPGTCKVDLKLNSYCIGCEGGPGATGSDKSSSTSLPSQEKCEATCTQQVRAETRHMECSADGVCYEVLGSAWTFATASGKHTSGSCGSTRS